MKGGKNGDNSVKEKELQYQAQVLQSFSLMQKQR